MFAYVSKHLLPYSNKGIFLIGVLGMLALSGCVAPQASIDKPETAVGEKSSNYVDSLGYQYSWTRTDARLISAPSSVKEEATAMCVSKGFDISFMKTISFSETEVIGYFSCRGLGSN